MMVRIFIIMDSGEVEVTNDPHIIRNLNWQSPRVRVINLWCDQPRSLT